MNTSKNNGNTYQSTQSSTCTVLYLDHASTPTPLDNLYHATGSRHLTSAISPSSVTEIESAYCTQCLQFWDAGSAFEACGGVCKFVREDSEGKATQVVGCTSCPWCGSALALDIQEDYEADESDGGAAYVCVYSCGYCHWTSADCNISIPYDTKENDMEKAMQKAQLLLTRRMESESRGTDELVNNLIQGWDAKNQLLNDEKRRRDQANLGIYADDRDGGGNKRGVKGVMGRKNRKGAVPTPTELIAELESGGWSIDSLEEATRQRKDRLDQKLLQGVLLPKSNDSDTVWNKLSIVDCDNVAVEQGQEYHMIPTKGARQNTISSANYNYDQATNKNSVMLPVPLPLRARYVRRCSVELEKGRPGILVKPKVNPLEGDSSLRFGHGQWWKKDCSAIHVVPKVQLLKHGSIHKSSSTTIYYALLLKIKNPTLGMVRLRLGNLSSSSLSKLNKGENDKIFPERYGALSFDSITMCKNSSKVIKPPTSTRDSSGVTTEMMKMVTLEPVEDAFLELGKGHGYDPPSVKEWDATCILTEFCRNMEDEEETKKKMNDQKDIGATTLLQFQLVEQVKDVAWIQCIIVDPNAVVKEKSNEFVCTPLSMDIEVGNGSWETSWIQPLKNKEKTAKDTREAVEENMDYASFTILPVWNS